MAQLTIDNYWFYFIYCAEPLQEGNTPNSLYRPVITHALCWTPLPVWASWTPSLLAWVLPFQSPSGGCLDHVSALSGPVGALRSLELASSSLSTSLPLSTVAFTLVTFWKEQKSTVGFCFCFYKDTHTHIQNSHKKVLPRFLFSPFQYMCCRRSTIRPISKQVFLKGKKVFSPFGPFPCFLEKQLKVTSGNFRVPLLRF